MRMAVVPMSEMRHLLVAVALAAMLVFALPASAGVAGDTSEGNITSGASLSGALSVHESNLEGEVHERSINASVEVTASDDKRAAFIARSKEEMDRRITMLQQRRTELKRAHDEGHISDNAYRVQVARLTAETKQLLRILRILERQSEQLPTAVREEYGIDEAAWEQTRSDAETIVDEEFEGTYRTVVGDDVRRHGPPHEYFEQNVSGMIADTQRVHDMIDRYIDELRSHDGASQATIECMARNHTAAQEDIDRARAAAEKDDTKAAETALFDARLDFWNIRQCMEDGDVRMTPSSMEPEFEDENWNETRYEEYKERHSEEYNWEEDYEQGDYQEDDYDGSWEEDDYNRSRYEEYNESEYDDSK